MKGLLLKDWYCLMGYMRAFFIICLAFFVGGIFVEENTFLLYYPCIMCGILSMSLLSYEEKEGWGRYSLALPCSRAMLVSGKYVLSLLLALACIVLAAVSQTISMVLRGSFSLEALMSIVSLALCLSLLPTALMLPFIYKYGAEKGRIAYYIVLGSFCGLLGFVMNNEMLFSPAVPQTNALVLLGAPVAMVVFGLSWWISIGVYEKREL